MSAEEGFGKTAAEREAHRLLEVLSIHGATVALAESCTGGLAAAAITSIPGASAYFWGSIVSYANEAKENILSVPGYTLRTYGAVSEETVRAMAEGALRASGADFSAAVSGIAGPDGGTPDKPVGTVWIGLASREGARKETLLSLRGDRNAIRQAASARLLAALRSFVEERQGIALTSGGSGI